MPRRRSLPRSWRFGRQVSAFLLLTMWNGRVAERFEPTFGLSLRKLDRPERIGLPPRALHRLIHELPVLVEHFPEIDRALRWRSTLMVQGTRASSSSFVPQSVPVSHGRTPEEGRNRSMLYSPPHARIPRPRRRHLLHRSHRPDRLRHRPADSAVLRAALRRRRVGLRRGRRRVLADAVRGDGAARETV